MNTTLKFYSNYESYNINDNTYDLFYKDHIISIPIEYNIIHHNINILDEELNYTDITKIYLKLEDMYNIDNIEVIITISTIKIYINNLLFELLDNNYDLYYDMSSFNFKNIKFILERYTDLKIKNSFIDFEIYYSC